MSALAAMCRISTHTLRSTVEHAIFRFHRVAENGGQPPLIEHKNITYHNYKINVWIYKIKVPSSGDN